MRTFTIAFACTHFTDVTIFARERRPWDSSVLGDEAKATATQAAKYQELLGQHQDHCAAADALTAMAEDAAAQDDPELSFTLGRLTERHRAARRPLREEFLSLYHRP